MKDKIIVKQRVYEYLLESKKERFIFEINFQLEVEDKWQKKYSKKNIGKLLHELEKEGKVIRILHSDAIFYSFEDGKRTIGYKINKNYIENENINMNKTTQIK